jgi:hypothetical protein
MRRSILIMAVASTACGKLSTNFPDPDEGMRFVPVSYGHDHAARSQHVDMPFQLKQQGVNGTALLLGFLQTVEQSGAKYISSVSYSLELVYRGMPVECVSTILVDDGHTPAPPPPEPPPADDEYTTTVKPWSPELEDRSVTEREMVCQQRAGERTHREHRWAADYNAEVKRNPNPEARTGGGYNPHTESRMVDVTDATFYDACSFDAAQRFVHRYAHFIAAKFVPPDLDKVGKIYSDFKLVELPPACHRVDRVAGAPLRQHLAADLHFVGSVDATRESIAPGIRDYRASHH